MRRKPLWSAAAIAAASVTLAAATAAADAPGAFVIGDGNAAAGSAVEFWGAQWWKLNSLTGGRAPASFKGFAVTVDPTGPCSGTFTTDPGNSSGPPPALGDGAIAVLVTGNVTKTGPVISGTYTNIVLVAPDPGYAPDPGHAGTGTVLGPAPGCGDHPPV